MYAILLTLFYGMIDTKRYLIQTKDKNLREGKITVDISGQSIPGADPGDYSDSYAVDGNFHYQDHVRALCSVNVRQKYFYFLHISCNSGKLKTSIFKLRLEVILFSTHNKSNPILKQVAKRNRISYVQESQI